MAMKIYTNDGNPLALKLLMLAKFAKSPVSVENVNLNDAAGKEFYVLPTLELDGGQRLFSTDAIAKYLFPNEGQLRDEWLEWSSTMLTPALAHYMGVGHHADPNAPPVLNALIKKINERLSFSPYLAGDLISAADIAVWSLLAPEGTLKGAQHIRHLREWYDKILKMPEVQQVLAAQPLQNLTFTALQSSNRYGGLHHIPLNISSHPDAERLLAETSANIGDTVSDEELTAARAAFVLTQQPFYDSARPISAPKAGERNILITSALPYVNNVPHLGNIIGCVLSADIFARYSRSAGYNTMYICGTDEYGTATENKALAENLTPKQICDKYFDLHNSIYCWFNIGFDYFGRTTNSEQTEIVQQAFKDINANGFIFKQSVEQLLCQKCDRFLADRFVEGTCPHAGCGYEDARGDQCDKCGKLVNATDLIRPRCKVCNTAPVVRSSEHLFLDLPKIEPKLRAWVETAESGWTNNTRVITRAWLRDGLKPRCITRDLKWGIPVPFPGFDEKVFYVWFDAPFGYVSMTKRFTKDYQQWWQPAADVNVELFQFMAKDNVPFHAVMWPSALLAINKGHQLVNHIMATEYLNYEDGKFSKSRGIGVFGNDAQETGIGADVWRFYLAGARPEAQDSSFSWNDLAARNNSELLNNLGNFINRALVFIERFYNHIVPVMKLTNEDVKVLALINRELRSYHQSLERGKLRDGIRHLLSISRHGNGYMQSQKPWALLKGSDDQKLRAGTTIGVCCNIVCLLAHLIFPYMPQTARNLFKYLKIQPRVLNAENPVFSILLPAGHRVGLSQPLFEKLDQSFIDELKKRYSGAQESSASKLPSVEELQKAIEEQGEKVRELKARTKDKKIWQPEVNILLELKKKLFEAEQATVEESYKPSIAYLETAIEEQAEKVRQLQLSSNDSSVWQADVNILFDLKDKLIALRPQVKLTNAEKSPAPLFRCPTVCGDPVKIHELTQRVNAQVAKVYNMKCTQSNQTLWKPEMDLLQSLKSELAALTGNVCIVGGKKTKKQKKAIAASKLEKEKQKEKEKELEQEKEKEKE